MIHTECGILLQINTKSILEQEFIDRLKKLQHRGREAYGIAHFVQNTADIQKHEGIIKNNNHQSSYINKSNLFLGHTRYSTSGSKKDTNLIQPILLNTRTIYQSNNNSMDNKVTIKDTPIIFAFNGNIRHSIWSELLKTYPIFTESDNQNYNDTYKIKLLLEYLLVLGLSFDEISNLLLEYLPTAYCLVISTIDTTWVIRDSLGNRPLSIYTAQSDINVNTFSNQVTSLIISSETNVVHDEELAQYSSNQQNFSQYLQSKWFNVESNNVIKIFHSRHQPIKLSYLKPSCYQSQQNNQIKNNKCQPFQKFCVFEKIYFMNSKSLLTDSNTTVSIYRQNLMTLLINQILESQDNYNLKHILQQLQQPNSNSITDNIIISGIPETGMEYANALSNYFKVPLTPLIQKKPNYQLRTFICGNDEERQQACIQKYDIKIELIKNKILILVDDSIVRGNTLHYLITYIKKFKPKQIHILIPSPPVAYPCYYGVDIPTRQELVINKQNTIENIRKEFKIDSLYYLDVERIKKNDINICDHCFTGKDIVDMF